MLLQLQDKHDNILLTLATIKCAMNNTWFFLKRNLCTHVTPRDGNEVRRDEFRYPHTQT